MTERTICRACNGADLVSVLDLGQQPLANRLLTDEQLEWQEPDFPLHMVRCVTCGLCQLTHVIDPETLYRDYRYESGHAPGWHQHCSALAEEIHARYPGGSVLDIAANDGTLLRYCHHRGLSVLGVDPARNLDIGRGLPVLQEFWPVDLPDLYDVIVAQNVFGHVDDCRRFLQGIAGALQKNGTALIEVPMVEELISHTRWDTIYHEHLSYWSFYSLRRLAREVGLFNTGFTFFPDLHGGTGRFEFGHHPRGDFAAFSTPLRPKDYDHFHVAVEEHQHSWADWFALRKKWGKAVAGYGASAKSSTFLNAMPERPYIVGIFDDNPLKQNLYTPGCHYPILKPTKILAEVDELVNFAPNWSFDEKAKALGFTGTVVSTWLQ